MRTLRVIGGLIIMPLAYMLMAVLILAVHPLCEGASSALEKLKEEIIWLNPLRAFKVLKSSLKGQTDYSLKGGWKVIKKK